MNFKNKVLDFDLKNWSIYQYLATITYLIYLVLCFTRVYAYGNWFNLRVTVFLIPNVLVSTYNYLYTVGYFTNMQPKIYIFRLLIPLGIWVGDFVVLLILSMSFNLGINFIGILIPLVSYIVYALAQYKNFDEDKFISAELSEDLRTVTRYIEE